MVDKFFIIFVLLFSLKVFSSPKNSVTALNFNKGENMGFASINIANRSTEADFNIACPDCKANKNFESLSDIQKCLKIINSKKCQDIPVADRKTCTKKDDTSFFDIGSILGKCIKDTAMSYQFIFDLLWYSVKTASSWLAKNSAENSPSKSYILFEFYKAYSSSEGTVLNKLLNSAFTVGGQTFKRLWSAVKEFLYKEYQNLECYKSQVKTAMACSFLAGLFVPGAGSLVWFKYGGKIIKNPILQTKRAGGFVAKKLQLKNFTQTMRVSFSDFKKKSIESSKNLPEKQRQEIQRFFRNVNKEQFIFTVRNALAKSKKNITREQIKHAVIVGLTVGTFNNVTRLSQKSATTLTEGLTDTLVTKYIHESIEY